jgi:hypothetical protein
LMISVHRKTTTAMVTAGALIMSAFVLSHKAPDFASDAVGIDSGNKAPRSIKGYRTCAVG